MNSSKIIFLTILLLSGSICSAQKLTELEYATFTTGEMKSAGFIDERSYGIIGDLATNKFLGTGFVVTKSDLIITADHVVDNYTKIVYIPGGSSEKIPLEIIKRFPEYDLAVLRSSKKITDKPLKIAKYKKVKVKDPLMYVAYDLKRKEFIKACSIIKIIGKAYYNFSPFVFDCFTFPGQAKGGYSGSPVFNTKCEVIGIIQSYSISKNPNTDSEKIVVSGVSLEPIYKQIK
ncbi:MAG: trypsin-like peptidase domain-containing protein [Mariniphaga sp.]|nr:trypsin-like peptidase domain-containing protein [Mariniphaga sp.]